MLVTGRLPFSASEPEILNKQISEGKFAWPVDISLQAPIKQFVFDLLQKVPSGESIRRLANSLHSRSRKCISLSRGILDLTDRLGSKDYRDIFEHEFFKGINWNEYGEAKLERNLSFDVVEKCMNRSANGISPIVSPKTLDKRRRLFAKDNFEVSDYSSDAQDLIFGKREVREK